jgi:hypothetical protein
MRPLEYGEFMRVLSPALMSGAFGVSFIEVTGARSTYWVIRDTTGQFVTYSRRSYLEVSK